MLIFFICCRHVVIYSAAILYSFSLSLSLPLRFVLLLFLSAVHDMLFDSIIVQFSFPVLLVDSNNRLAVRVNDNSSPKYRSGFWMKTGMSWADFRFVLEHRNYRWKPSDQAPLCQYRENHMPLLPRFKNKCKEKTKPKLHSITMRNVYNRFHVSAVGTGVKNKRSKLLLPSRFLKRKAMQEDGQVDPVLSV